MAYHIQTRASIFHTGVLMLSALHIACPFSYGGRLRISTTVKYGRFYRYDPRLVLESIKNPLNLSSIKQSDTTEARTAKNDGSQNICQ